MTERAYHITSEERHLDDFRQRLVDAGECLGNHLPAVVTTPTERMIARLIQSAMAEFAFGLAAIDERMARLNSEAADSVLTEMAAAAEF